MDGVLGSLLQACADGDPETLLSCLQYGLDLNFMTEDGLTPLMYAVTYAGSKPQGDYYTVVQMLLEAGAHPDVFDALSNRTAAHYAAHCKQSMIFELLMNSGCDIVVCDVEGESPFHLAITNGLEHCVEVMVDNNPALLNYPTLNGTAPIILAARAGNTKLCQFCLEQGCDPNTVDLITLQSPLHAAAEGGHAAIIGMLLRKQQTILDASDARGLTPVHLASSNNSSAVLSTICDIVGSTVLELTDTSGLTPLMYACISGSEACAEFMIKKKVNLLAKDSTEGKTCLHWAAESVVCSPETVSLLCKKKKQLLTETDAHGRIPLHSAAISGNVGALKLLLNLATDCNVVDNNQYTAVHLTVVSGQPTALEELMAHGCLLNLPEKNGATPLHLAAQASAMPAGDDDEDAALVSDGARQCMKLLLDAGVTVSTADNEGRHPIHWALQGLNNLDAIKLLISGGADPNAKMGDGLPGLHVAAKHGMTDNCRCLIEEFNIDGNSTDDHGQTPLFYSIESQAIDCSNYLLSIGCSANHKNNEGRSPVHIAATVGSLEGLELLSSYNGDINAQSVQYVTPLHDAAVNGQISALTYILAAGGNPNPSTSEEIITVPSPLHYAVSEGYTDCVQLLIEAGANVNAYIISEEKIPLTPLDYAVNYPELKELLLSHNALPGTDIEVPIPQEVKKPEDEESELTEPPKEEEEQEMVQDVEHKQAPPTILKQQISRERIDPFDIIDHKPQPKSKSLLSRLVSFRRQRPPPDSIQSSVIGLYGAQATMLVGGFIGTALGEKTVEIAHKVATDTAVELKKSAALAEEEEVDVMTLEWLDTPVQVPSPSPEPLAEVPPTPQPSPPPKVEFHMTPDERRMKKAKAQMDETKSLAFRALEELLKAQKTQSQLRRQFVMAQLKENAIVRREEAIKKEQEAKEKSDQILTHYNKRMEEAANESEKINTQITEQLESAYKVNTEIAYSMSKLGISSRPTVSEWLRRKDEEKRAQIKSTLHSWQSEKQQRDMAISLKHAITSHRTLHHIAWNTKKELSAQNNALQKGHQIRTIRTHTKPKTALTTHTGSHRIDKTRLGSNLVQTRRIMSQVTSRPKPISTGGCIRATPFGFVKSRTEDEPLAPTESRHTRRSSSLPDTTLWNMGLSYAGHDKTMFYSGISHRAYGPKTVHPETTLQFVPPSEYKKNRRALQSPDPTQLPSNYSAKQQNDIRSPLHSGGGRVQFHSHAERDRQTRRQSNGIQSETILPMKIIDQPIPV